MTAQEYKKHYDNLVKVADSMRFWALCFGMATIGMSLCGMLFFGGCNLILFLITAWKTLDFEKQAEYTWKCYQVVQQEEDRTTGGRG